MEWGQAEGDDVFKLILYCGGSPEDKPRNWLVRYSSDNVNLSFLRPLSPPPVYSSLGLDRLHVRGSFGP